MATRIGPVQLIPAGGRWHTRHQQEGVECDSALFCTDPDDVQAALDEALAHFGYRFRREDIEVLS